MNEFVSALRLYTTRGYNVYLYRHQMPILKPSLQKKKSHLNANLQLGRLAQHSLSSLYINVTVECYVLVIDNIYR